jgi:hypothetical protein
MARVLLGCFVNKVVCLCTQNSLREPRPQVWMGSAAIENLSFENHAVNFIGM